MRRYTGFIATKEGLAAALHSGDPAFAALPGYFSSRFGPALQALLDTAAAAGAIRPGVQPDDLLAAVANLSVPDPLTGDTARSGRMVALLLDGLRYNAPAQPAGVRA